jgi:hypothetical protein
MTWTRTQYMVAARNAADAAGSDRWTDDEIRIALGAVHAREWKKLLNVNRYLRKQAITVTTDSNGRIELAALTTGSGNTAKRFYRVLELMTTDGARVYQEVDFNDLPTATLSGQAGSSSSSSLYYLDGDYLQLLPVESGLSIIAAVNHIPPRIDQLGADTDSVEWPEDHELVIAYEAAAHILMKGATEASAAAGLQELAEQLRQDMNGDLGRKSTTPQFIGYTDRREEWGG